MEQDDLVLLVDRLLNIGEAEWVEFKKSVAIPEEIGEYISALANAAALSSEPCGFLVWGIDDVSKTVCGTDFRPRQQKIGNEELEGWLVRLLTRNVHFTIHEGHYGPHPVVVFEIAAAVHTPVGFKSQDYIRVGTYKKNLREYSERSRRLWAILSRSTFETEVALTGRTGSEALSLLDYPAYFSLTSQPLPEGRRGIIDRLTQERFIAPEPGSRYGITNLGAILFARTLEAFPSLQRKMVRIIQYRGRNRIATLREHQIREGYAAAFAPVVEYVNSLLPRNEVIGQALRGETAMYPELAIRELVANALIHQDFRLTGTGPTIEIFSDRIEMTNPGTPLIEPLRFLDEPPRSRNEALAAFLRRANICEERGSGIDKVVFQAEVYQLPPPDFRVTDSHTTAVLFAHKPWGQMDRRDRVRACYQHACLLYVSNDRMSNATLRKRFGIAEQNYSMVSRVIADAIKENLIRPYDPEGRARNKSSYVPFWAM